jgi:hypothetical protein
MRGSNGRYVALSHKWVDGYTVKTTLANMEDRKHRIAWATLPRTFQEAIVVARALKLNYIWIDSLCIIQGIKSSDWKEEALRIATYYSNACFTISASSPCSAAQFLTSLA